MKTQTIRTISGLGKRSSHLLADLAGRGRSIFSTEEAHATLGGSRASTYKLLHDLVQRGWLQSLGKGQYLIIPLAAGPERWYTIHEFQIAHHLAPEGYIAYWTALHHHGLTEQVPRTVWVATPRRRRERAINGVTYTFVTLRPHKVFGQQPVWIEGQRVSLASLEKSLVDALDHPAYCGGIVEVAKALSTALTERDISLERLSDYADRMGNRAIFKRLGYLCERLPLPVANYAEQWQTMLSAGYARLDPDRPATGTYDQRWRLLINVTEAEFTGWMEE